MKKFVVDYEYFIHHLLPYTRQRVYKNRGEDERGRWLRHEAILSDFEVDSDAGSLGVNQGTTSTILSSVDVISWCSKFQSVTKWTQEQQSQPTSTPWRSRGCQPGDRRGFRVPLCLCFIECVILATLYDGLMCTVAVCSAISSRLPGTLFYCRTLHRSIINLVNSIGVVDRDYTIGIPHIFGVRNGIRTFRMWQVPKKQIGSCFLNSRDIRQ